MEVRSKENTKRLRSFVQGVIGTECITENDGVIFGCFCYNINEEIKKKEGIIMIPAKAVLDTTKASFAMEGMYATENDEKNIMDVRTGKRSLEDVIKEIKHKYMVEKE